MLNALKFIFGPVEICKLRKPGTNVIVVYSVRKRILHRGYSLLTHEIHKGGYSNHSEITYTLVGSYDSYDDVKNILSALRSGKIPVK